MQSNNTNRNSILVIEDEHNIRVTIRCVLEAEGYLVFSAANGILALEILQRIPPPGVILLDLIMPLMSGQVFLKEKNSNPLLAKIPVIAMSALPDAARLAKADGFLQKPIHNDELLNMIARYCTKDQGR